MGTGADNRRVGERITNFVLDMIPPVAVAKAGIELSSGKTLLGGEKLSSAQIVLDAATVATAGLAKYVGAAGRIAEELGGGRGISTETISKTVDSVSIGSSGAAVAISEVKDALGAIRSAWQSANDWANSWWKANISAPPKPPNQAPGFYDASQSTLQSNGSK